MSELLQRLQAMAPGEHLDWRKVREDIHDEHDRATTTAERVTLLEIFEAVMDEIERSGMVQELEMFKEGRRQDYALLIAKEARVGENVCAETLDAITEREVAAGRMALDDPIRQAALAAMAAPHFTRAELIAMEANKRVEPASVGARIMAWIKQLIR